MSTAERSTPPRAPSRPPVDEDSLLTVPDRLVHAVLITDPGAVRRIKLRRERSPSAPRDEVWDGVYIMSPMADIEHQVIGLELASSLLATVKRRGGGWVVAGLNVSDRIEDWKANYRIPDVAVFLAGNPAIIRKAHACGGPDLAVEILSEDDLARQKLEFYAKIGTREVVLIDRDPWAIELYRLADGALALVGISTPAAPEVLTSTVLPITLRLLPGDGRPTLEVASTDHPRVWRI